MTVESGIRPEKGQGVPLGAAVLLFMPTVVLRFSGAAPAPLLAVVIYAAGFIGAALLLAWGTELAQLDLPQGLAVAILAFVAILPEYAVDLLFAFQAGEDPSKAPLALANMTGANRLLIGIGWSLVVLIAAVSAGRRQAAANRAGGGTTEGETGDVGGGLGLSALSSVDVVVLGLVSVYTLQFAVRSTLTLVDTAVLFSTFAFYAYRLFTAPKQEPDFLGPPAWIATFGTRARRAVTLTFMIVAAAVILSIAEPFSSSLVEAGRQLGVEEFLMVQWIAPLATESAELIPAALFAWRLSGDEALGTLLSSKINQWTLLVGAVPVAFAVSTVGLNGLPIDPVQRQELLLTAAQSIFAVSLLADDLRLGVKEAVLILSLFLADFAASVLLPEDVRMVLRFGFSGLYLALAAGQLFRIRRRLPALLRRGLRTPAPELAKQS